MKDPHKHHALLTKTPPCPDQNHQTTPAITSTATPPEAKTALLRLRTERAMTAAGPEDTVVEDGPDELAEAGQVEGQVTMKLFGWRPRVTLRTSQEATI